MRVWNFIRTNNGRNIIPTWNVKQMKKYLYFSLQWIISSWENFWKNDECVNLKKFQRSLRKPTSAFEGSIGKNHLLKYRVHICYTQRILGKYNLLVQSLWTRSSILFEEGGEKLMKNECYQSKNDLLWQLHI